MELLLEYGPLSAMILLGLFGIAKLLINELAKRPVVDGWDKAKAIIDQISPFADKLEAWADPGNDAVPPSPNNPGGLG